MPFWRSESRYLKIFEADPSADSIDEPRKWSRMLALPSLPLNLGQAM